MKVQGYEILNLLGSGGMGVVHLAVQSASNREVALKLLSPDSAHDSEYSAVFENEGKIASKLNHPHIIHIYDRGFSKEGLPYIAMEYLPAGDLKTLIMDPSNRHMALLAVKQIAWALLYTHSTGVVHGDVKPQNILFAHPGRAVLSDFGVVFEAEPGTDIPAHVLGSPSYISPEQVLGNSPDHRSDIYSLGAVLFEVLAGHPPFQGDTALATARQRLDQEFAPELPAQYLSFQFLIDRMMAVSPNERMNSLQDFIEDFHQLIQAGTDAIEKGKTQRIPTISNQRRSKEDECFIVPINNSNAQEQTTRIPVQNEKTVYDELYSYESSEPSPETVKNQRQTTVQKPSTPTKNKSLIQRWRHQLLNKLPSWNWKKLLNVTTTRVSLGIFALAVITLLLHSSQTDSEMLLAVTPPSPFETTSARQIHEQGSEPGKNDSASSETESASNDPVMGETTWLTQQIQDSITTMEKTEIAVFEIVTKKVPVTIEPKAKLTDPVSPVTKTHHSKSVKKNSKAATAKTTTTKKLSLRNLKNPEIELQNNHPIISREIEAALGPQVKWMMRNEDGSLSLFIEWADLIYNEETTSIEWIDLIGKEETLSNEAMRSLSLIASTVQGHDGYLVSVSDNSILTQKPPGSRAKLIHDYLISQGVPGKRLTAQPNNKDNSDALELRLIPVLTRG